MPTASRRHRGRARRRSRPRISRPLCASLVVAAAPGAAGLGCAQQRMDHRGRLRWRVPLCQPSFACVEEPRSGWPGALCGHLQQGAFSEPPACLSRRAGNPGRAVRGDHSTSSQAAVPELTQTIVTAFITEGHFARHIQRMRKLYAARREATGAGLESALGKYVRIASPPGGMHLILGLRGRRSDRGLVARMREEGLHGEALTDWAMRPRGCLGAASSISPIIALSSASPKNLGRPHREAGVTADVASLAERPPASDGDDGRIMA